MIENIAPNSISHGRRGFLESASDVRLSGGAVHSTRFNIGTDLIAPARANGKMVTLPLVMGPAKYLKGPKAWAESAHEMAMGVMEGARRMFDLPVVFAPMDLSWVPASLGETRIYPPGSHHPQCYSSTRPIDAALNAFDQPVRPDIGKVRIEAISQFNALGTGAIVGDYLPGPWTLATMIADNADIGEDQVYWADGCKLDRLLQRAVQHLGGVAQESYDAGARVFGILEPNLTSDDGMMQPNDFSRFVVYAQKLNEVIHRIGGSTVFHVCGCTTDRFEQILGIGADVISVDPRRDPRHIATVDDVVAFLERMNTFFEQAPDKKCFLATGLPTPQVAKMSVAEVTALTLELSKVAAQYPLFVGGGTCEMPWEVPREVTEAHFKVVREASLA